MSPSVALLVFTCVSCGGFGSGNPLLVISVPYLRRGQGQPPLIGTEVPAELRKSHREPLCRRCAKLLIDRAEMGELESFPAHVLEPDYLDRAYGTGADARDLDA
jgi:hypothetical protein